MELSDKSLLKLEAFISGKWVAADGQSYFEVIDPATSKSIARLPDLGSEYCTEAVHGAVKAFSVLGKMTGKERGELLRNWFNLMMAAREDLATIISAENGKTLMEARGEVTYAADFLDWFSGAAPRIEGTVIQASNHSNRVVTIKQSVGPVGIVTPWNFPAAMITRKVGAAIAAGCPCVVKPAAETPLTALALTELAQRAGLPTGALSIVTSQKHTVEVGKILTQHPSIRKFSFTGSTMVGKLLAAQCTTTMKRVSLELGGNAPIIVFNDADLQKATDGILASKFRLSGQTCAVQKVKKHVDDAVSRGAETLIGGQPATALGEAFFEPTILVGVSSDSLCAQEETFGPLLPLLKFQTEEDVLRMANSAEVGLAGYFFTEDVSRAWRVAEAMEVGMVGVNTGLISDVASPFGGLKESGHGREGSNLGIEEYLEVKSITFGVGN